MDDEQISRRRFVRGLLLAWIPIALVMVPTIVRVISEMSNQKATGLGAVAGGFSEALTTLGVIAFFAAEIFAVVLLARSLSKGQPVRSFLATVSLCVGAFAVLLISVALWFLIYESRIGHS